jgi:hypothetical protein
LELGLPFRFLEVEPIALLWPVASAGKEQEMEGEDDDAGTLPLNGWNAKVLSSKRSGMSHSMTGVVE